MLTITPPRLPTVITYLSMWFLAWEVTVDYDTSKGPKKVPLATKTIVTRVNYSDHITFHRVFIDPVFIWCV